VAAINVSTTPEMAPTVFDVVDAFKRFAAGDGASIGDITGALYSKYLEGPHAYEDVERLQRQIRRIVLSHCLDSANCYGVPVLRRVSRGRYALIDPENPFAAAGVMGGQQWAAALVVRPPRTRRVYILKRKNLTHNRRDVDLWAAISALLLVPADTPLHLAGKVLPTIAKMVYECTDQEALVLQAIATAGQGFRPVSESTLWDEIEKLQTGRRKPLTSRDILVKTLNDLAARETVEKCAVPPFTWRLVDRAIGF
jgi:hypothetical protein